MILIFSENISYSARYVTRHLHLLKKEFNVFLENDTIEFQYNFKTDSIEIDIYKNDFFLCKYSDIKSVWAHRSEILVRTYPHKINTKEEVDYVLGHNKTRIELIQKLLHKKKCLGRFDRLNYNKMIFLEVCRELNIKIPGSLITQKKEDLKSFFDSQKNGIIVKSIANNFNHCISISAEEQIWQKGMTIGIDVHKLNQVLEVFDLSLFQEKLDKKYELRVLYVDGICFAQIIFSQKHAFSEVDYRQGLGGSEMRQCNFKLPQPVVSQIKVLMNALDLNIGCIDIVVTKQDEFVFLEVNPSGIFTDMMDNCNYDMHYEIAKYLAS